MSDHQPLLQYVLSPLSRSRDNTLQRTSAHDRAAGELRAARRNGRGDEAGECDDGNGDSGLEEVHVWLGGVVGSSDKVLEEQQCWLLYLSEHATSMH